MERYCLITLLLVALVCNTNSFHAVSTKTGRTVASTRLSMNLMRFVKVSIATTALTFAVGAEFSFNGDQLLSITPSPVHARGKDVEAGDAGANEAAQTKIRGGGASTLQRGIVKTITRGVNLDKSDFSGANLKGVAFQQSIVRYCSFKDANLFSASFFDATLDGSDFENADMTQANIELAQLKGCNLKNTIAKQMYVVGTTLFEGIGSIENSDWSDTDLSKYQRKYLCSLPSATGTNSVTGESTRESLQCDISAVRDIVRVMQNGIIDGSDHRGFCNS